MLGWRAFWLLGFHFWRHILKKITFLYDRGGERRFVENYRPDRIFPVPEQARESLPEWQRCTACGLCDAVAARPEQSLMGLVVSGLRDFSAHTELAEDARHFTDVAALERAEQVCPSQVPIREVVHFLATADARGADLGGGAAAR